VYFSSRESTACGDVHKQPELAARLRIIAERGRLYAGRIAEGIVFRLRALGGLHTMEDFAAVTGDGGSSPVRDRMPRGIE
jgi:gamma-glutamyltranspeptidase/glutathione hydrolase